MKEDHKQNCRLDGCEEGLLNPELCRGCGWDKVEEARRRLLPLTRCEDGLYRIIVTTPAAAAPMTRGASIPQSASLTAPSSEGAAIPQALRASSLCTREP